MNHESKNYFESIKICIDEWNPYNLLPEAPSDEFDEESRMISSKIKTTMTAEQIAEVVSGVFIQMFVPEDFSVENCKEVSINIYNAIHTKT